MRFILVAAILPMGCTHTAPERPELLYDAAASHFRAGALPRARNEAERGMSVAAGRHDSRLEWQFRLLHAEVLLFSGSAGPALAELGGGMSETPEFAPLAARKLLLQG